MILIGKVDSLIKSGNKEIIFNRLGLMERGHFSNYFTLLPVKQLRIAEDYIVIRKLFTEHKFLWNEIIKIDLYLKTAYKAYGRFASAKFEQHLLALRTKDKVFRFDVSHTFPDFRNADVLISELQKHITINIIKQN